MPKPPSKNGAIRKGISLWTENFTRVESMAVAETRGNFSLAVNIALSSYFKRRKPLEMIAKGVRHGR